VNGIQQSLWSNLGMLLAEHNLSVLALYKRSTRKPIGFTCHG